MSLNANVLANLISQKIDETFGEDLTAERKKMAKAIAEAIVDHIKESAVVVVPSHHSRMTSPNAVFKGVTAGGQAFQVAPHRHLVAEQKHQNGKII